MIPLLHTDKKKRNKINLVIFHPRKIAEPHKNKFYIRKNERVIEKNNNLYFDYSHMSIYLKLKFQNRF